MPRSIKTFPQILVAVVVLTLATPFAAPAASAAGGDGETVKLAAAHDLPNLPGKCLTAVATLFIGLGSSHDRRLEVLVLFL